MKKELTIDGKKIVYHVHGKGRTVMLIHGFGETGAIWKNLVEHLESKFRLIIPDLPGSGASELIPDMSMEGMAEVIKKIIDQEKQTQSAKDHPAAVPDLVVIGHSMGGYITLAFLERYAEEVAAFGLFHSSAFADSEEKIATRKKGIAFIKEHGAYEFLKTATPNLFAPDSKAKFSKTIDELIEEGHNFSPETLVSYYESMIKRPDRTAVLKNSKVPVLFIMGKHDNAIPLEDVLKQSHLPDKAVINILHDSGHMGMLEETEKSNRLLEEFLNEP
jgi:pimeloyl-ACP methyl ester carboxylesterase